MGLQRVVAALPAVICVVAAAMAADVHGTPLAMPGLDQELAAIAADPAHPLASLSTLAVRHGKVVYHRQFGFRTIDNENPSRNIAAGPETLYRIASISKLVTTLGVMRLRDAGKLDLDRDVSDYLGWPLRNPHFPESPITLRMLLSHTSSLRDDAGYYWEATLGVRLQDVLVPGGNRHGDGAMWAANAKPGAYFQYANLPWGVVGTIVERVTGERFDRALKRLVLDPLHLHGGFEPADFSAADLAQVATLYRKRVERDGKEIWEPAGPWIAQVDDYRNAQPVPRATPEYVVGTNGTLFGPQGNCRLSAAGLATIMQMLMRDGVHRGQRFLRLSSVALMRAAQWRRQDDGNGNDTFGAHRELMNAWGLGMHLFVDRGGDGAGDRLVKGGGFTGVGHLGDAWGLTSAMVFDPRTRNGMIFLTGGPGFDPQTYPGIYGSMYRHEEKILTALHRHAR
ncbi:MAG: serine hydrolase domain-containing protein, partial [Betaproteobacteria bacterium]